MRFCIWMAAAAVAFDVSAASAALRIFDDSGGRIGTYVETFTAARDSGEQVVIDGRCLSACTLVLGIVPRERICVTENALMGFHAAWVPDSSGQRVINSAGTRALWDIYPAKVRKWIRRNGGLDRNMIFLRGRQLTEMYPACR
jgi:hypothetical protein